MFKRLLKRIVSAIIKEVLEEVGITPLSSLGFKQDEITYSNQRKFK